jgi:hypothetical protein
MKIYTSGILLWYWQNISGEKTEIFYIEETWKWASTATATGLILGSCISRETQTQHKRNEAFRVELIGSDALCRSRISNHEYQQYANKNEEAGHVLMNQWERTHRLIYVRPIYYLKREIRSSYLMPVRVNDDYTYFKSSVQTMHCIKFINILPDRQTKCKKMPFSLYTCYFFPRHSVHWAGTLWNTEIGFGKVLVG